MASKIEGRTFELRFETRVWIRFSANSSSIAFWWPVLVIWRSCCAPGGWPHRQPEGGLHKGDERWVAVTALIFLTDHLCIICPCSGCHMALLRGSRSHPTSCSTTFQSSWARYRRFFWEKTYTTSCRLAQLGKHFCHQGRGKRIFFHCPLIFVYPFSLSNMIHMELTFHLDTIGLPWWLKSRLGHMDFIVLLLRMAEFRDIGSNIIYAQASFRLPDF